MQTAIAGSLYGVNAFDQPGVEAGEQITYKRLGRPRLLADQPVTATATRGR